MSSDLAPTLRACAALVAALLASCAVQPEDQFPPDSGWRTLTVVGDMKHAHLPPFRDCRSVGPPPYVVLRETEKVNRFMTVHRDWLMPQAGNDARPGDAVIANASSCAAGYHIAPP